MLFGLHIICIADSRGIISGGGGGGREGGGGGKEFPAIIIMNIINQRVLSVKLY